MCDSDHNQTKIQISGSELNDFYNDFYNEKRLVACEHQEYTKDRSEKLASNFIKYLKRIPEYEGYISIKLFDDDSIIYTQPILDSFKKILEEKFKGYLSVETTLRSQQEAYIKFSLKEMEFNSVLKKGEKIIISNNYGE